MGLIDKERTPERNLVERVLILAPEGRNAQVAAATLGQKGFRADVCADGVALVRSIEEGVGVVLLTDDFLHHFDLSPLQELLHDQPLWSDLPLVLLAWPQTGEQALAALTATGGNVRLIDRPASALTLVTGVESALRARRRQYEIRSLLAELRDLNENLESRVEQRTQKVRELAAALAQAEERERERIAQLLHDHLQQILVAVSIQLQLAGSTPAVEPALRRSLAEIEEMVGEALEATRSLSVELSPPVLRQAGLGAALYWLQSEMRNSHHLQITLTLDEPAAAAREELATLLFRTIRELLLNVVKHAHTQQAQVSAHQEQGQLVVTVTDQGRGFLMAEVETNGSGYGLPSIRERVALHGGNVQINTAPGEGTAVTIALPYL